MSVHALSPSRAADPVTQAKIDLAAAHRLENEIVNCPDLFCLVDLRAAPREI